jgi:hypothetical protein
MSLVIVEREIFPFSRSGRLEEAWPVLEGVPVGLNLSNRRLSVVRIFEASGAGFNEGSGSSGLTF